MRANTFSETAVARGRSQLKVQRCLVFTILGLALAATSSFPVRAAEQAKAGPQEALLLLLYQAWTNVMAKVANKPTAEQLAAMKSARQNTESASSLATVSAESYGCALWLDAARSTNNPSNVVVTLHNTVPALNYKLWTKTVLMPTQSWTLETNAGGTSGQNWTAVTVPRNGRANLFFLGGAGGFGTNKSFVGLQQSNSVASLPDAMGAVGPQHVMQVLNVLSGKVGVAVFDKCTGNLIQSATNEAFFSVQFGGTNYPTGQTFDPRVLYDHESQRWVATILDRTTRQLVLAVSKSSTPLNLLTNWDKHLLPVSVGGSSSDFGTLGVDKNGLYISVAQQDLVAGTISSNVIVTLKKPEIYQGNVISNFFLTHSNELPASAIFPAVNFDAEPRGGFAWFVAKKWPDRTSTNHGGVLAYRRMTWSGSNTAWADTNWVEVPNSPIYRDYFDLDKSGVTAPQGVEAPAIELYGTGSRLMSAVIQNGNLWTCQHVGLSGTNGHYPGHGGSTNVDRSGIQWLRIGTDTNGQFLTVTNGRIFDATNSNPFYYYCPSLMVNKNGDAITGFNSSRSGDYIRALYLWRTSQAAQPLQPLVLREGQDIAQHGSWGDYSAASLDPTDRLRIWLVIPCVPSSSLDNEWDTWIGEIVPDEVAP